MSFFKVNATAPPKPEVQHTEFKEFYPAANGNMAWATMSPFVEQAEELYIIPSIGFPLYNVLDLAYNSEDGITDADLARLFHLLRTALAAYASYLAMPELAMRLGDAGVRENNNRETMAARQWLYKENLWKSQLKAHKFLDQALYYCEQQVGVGNPTFDVFKTSDAYTVSRNYWIPNATVFSKFFNIANSRRTFVRLRPYIDKVQELEVRALLGDEMFAELASQFADGTLTAANLTLFEACQRYIAELTIVESIGNVNFVQDDSGWVTIENSNEAMLPASQVQLMSQQMESNAEVKAERFRVAIERILYGNLDNYPTFRDSSTNQSNNDPVIEAYPEDIIGAVDM